MSILNRIEKFIRKTPLEYSERLSLINGCDVFLKREDVQITRSFKVRGSLNKILKFKNKYKKFACASAGNHAQGVAFASNLLNLNSKIFVPDITPYQKINRIKNIGKDNIKLIKYGSNFTESLEYALKNVETDELFIHPFDDMDIIDGQGTIMDEILEEIEPDIILSCVGGGGLVSGLLNRKRELSKEIKIIGVEPFKADSMNLSLIENKVVNYKGIDTFVDGASVSRVGDIPFEICKKNNLELRQVTNNEISHHMVELFSNEGIITEPAGVLAVAGLNKLSKKEKKNRKVICIVSGGNQDLMRYPEIMERNLLYKNIKHYFIIDFNQKPNELKTFVNKVLDINDDITRFEYIKKTNKTYGNVLIGIDTLNIDNIVNNMNIYNYNFIKLKEEDIIYKYLV